MMTPRKPDVAMCRVSFVSRSNNSLAHQHKTSLARAYRNTLDVWPLALRTSHRAPISLLPACWSGRASSEVSPLDLGRSNRRPFFMKGSFVFQVLLHFGSALAYEMQEIISERIKQAALVAVALLLEGDHI